MVDRRRGAEKGDAVRLGNREPVPVGTNRRRARTAVLFTDLEWSAIVVAAATEGMRPGAWIARLAFAEAARHNSGTGLDRDLVAGLTAAVQEQRRVLANIGGNLNQLAKVANSTGEVENPVAARRVLELVRRVVGSSDELLVRIRSELT
ncbi:plasmid mobilization relaxosome protein MobC [Saccharothrix sp.]|uniref:plasmid mobilization relaxosome protein MobC n=1 Tax=Saccharothrix sp. TaxID=1873460 RepID=UPI002810BF71|nr:plasmid mobilization relaxosome protein MobC [Saccharothrix sp.]